MSAPIPTPPAIALSRRYYAIAGMAVALGLFAILVVPATAPLALVLLYIGLWFANFGRVIGRDAWGSAYSAAALQALTRGRFDDVEALHAKIPAASMKRGTVARAIAVQKALLALFRGSAENAIEAIAPALAPKVRLYTKSHERMQLSSAYGVRALAHAMNGDAAKAEADALAAEAFEEAMPDALARGRLARAMIVARGGDMIALGHALAKDGSLILENTMPRERALVRALRKMAHGRGRSVYREASKPSDGGNEPGALAGWIARVAPEAAAYASDDVVHAETSAEARAPVVTANAREAIAKARSAATTKTAGTTRRRKMLLGAVVLTLTLGAAGLAASLVSTIFAADAAGTAVNGATSYDPGLLAIAFAAIFAVAAAHVVQLRRTNRLNLALIGSHRAAALGDLAAAESLVRAGKSSSMNIFAGAAGATMARLAERRADFAACLVECDAAIARIGRRSATLALADQIMPVLLEQRALALAATGRGPEAEAELAALIAQYPTFSHLALADFRVRMVDAVHRGDFDAARAIAGTRTAELPLSLRDELLADLVLAMGPKGLPPDELERLAAELRDSSEATTWIDAVAPGLREVFASLAHGRARVASDAPRPSDREPTSDREDTPTGARSATLDS